MFVGPIPYEEPSPQELKEMRREVARALKSKREAEVLFLRQANLQDLAERDPSVLKLVLEMNPDDIQLDEKVIRSEVDGMHWAVVCQHWLYFYGQRPRMTYVDLNAQESLGDNAQRPQGPPGNVW